MQISQAYRFIGKYKDMNITELCLLMNEAYNKHSLWLEKVKNNLPWKRSEHINLEETFLLGLRYSEFYVENSTSDEEYHLAEQLRGVILEKLGYTREDINTACFKILGWR